MESDTVASRSLPQHDQSAGPESARPQASGSSRRTPINQARPVKAGRFVGTPSKFTLHITRAATRAALSNAQLIQSFSHDAQRQLHLDDRAKRIYVAPPAGANLKYGIEQAVWRENKDEHLDSLMFALKAGNHGSKLSTAHIVTFVSNMSKLCLANYERRDPDPVPWEMNVMLLGPTIFIEGHSTQTSRDENEGRLASPKGNSYCGVAFEQYCCASNPAQAEPTWPTGWSGNVNTNEQWIRLVQRELGGCNLLLAGETDCVRQTGEAVELKTSLQPTKNSWSKYLFARKLRLVNLRALLLDTPHVVFGFTTQGGKLQSHEEYETDKLRELAKAEDIGWLPELALDFGANVLGWMREALTSHASGTDVTGGQRVSEPSVWRLAARFHDKYRGTLTLRRLSASEVRKEVQEELDEDRVGFLKREDYDWIMRGCPSTSPTATHAATSA